MIRASRPCLKQASAIRFCAQSFDDWLAQNRLESSLITEADFKNPKITFLSGLREFRTELGAHPYVVQEDGTFALQESDHRRLLKPPLLLRELQKAKKWGNETLDKHCRGDDKTQSSKRDAKVNTTTRAHPMNGTHKDNNNEWETASGSKDIQAGGTQKPSCAIEPRAAIVVASHERAVLGVVGLNYHRIYAHKTFKTYAVRKGQGVLQSAADAKKGKRSSEGAQLRRRNAQNFLEKIRHLLLHETPYREATIQKFVGVGQQQPQQTQQSKSTLFGGTIPIPMVILRGETRVFGSLDLPATITQVKIGGSFMAANPETNKKATAEEEIERVSKKCLQATLVVEDAEC